jgi:hypothetical protein
MYKNIVDLNVIATLDRGTLKNKDLIRLKATSNCWICEGWTEFKFIFKVKEPIDD